MGKEFEFDFEKLQVYQKALVLIDHVFLMVKALPKEHHFSVGNNLIRAALSIANNLAEGNDKSSLKEKSRFFHIASDSARECASVFIVLQRQGLLSSDLFRELKQGIREITSIIRAITRNAA